LTCPAHVNTRITSIKVARHVEQRKRDQRLDAAHTAFDIARHAAGLPLQVKPQAQGVQVFERLQRNGARRTLRGLGKHQFAQFIEQRGGQAQRP
jgi:hypothetical protein